MKRILTVLAGAAALACAPAAFAQDQQNAEPKLSRGEAKLAKLLDGRTAGEATSCIRQFPNDSMIVIDKTAIVFKRGKTLWVNYTKRPASIDDNEILVIHRYGSSSRLCRTDIVSTIDRYAGFNTGNVFLSEFVPYRKAEG